MASGAKLKSYRMPSRRAQSQRYLYLYLNLSWLKYLVVNSCTYVYIHTFIVDIDIHDARLFPVRRFKNPLDLLLENLSDTSCEASLTKRFRILK
jgi:hypothetical protein